MNNERRCGSVAFSFLILGLVLSFIFSYTAHQISEKRARIAMDLEREEWTRKEEEYVDEALDSDKEIDALVMQIEEMEEQMSKLSALHDLLEPVGLESLLDLIEHYPTSTPFDSTFKVTAKFGEGPGYEGAWRSSHEGTDIVPSGNWIVTPMWDGTVIDIGIHSQWGKYIIIEHDQWVRTRHYHLDKIYFTALPGELVTTDTRMGVAGSTGNSDGAHLHLGMEVWDGEKWVAVDIYPFLEGRV